MLPRAKSKHLALCAALMLGACASQSGDQTGGLSLPTSPIGPSPIGPTVSSLPASPGTGYQLTAAEAELDCKKLTGRVAIRIVQIRDFQSRTRTTGLSRAIQTTSTTLLGGTLEGTDPDGRYARDRAILEAYNNRLIEKNCPSFDLAAELDPAAKDPPRVRMLKKS
jgi:hypothetical protein